MRKYSSLLLLTGLLVAMATVNAADSNNSPRELIMNASNQLVDSLRAAGERIKKDKSEAYRLAEDIIMPHIDFERLGKWTLGKHWRRASKEQREQFIQEFRTLLVHTYVTAMIEFSDKIVSSADSVSYPPLLSKEGATDVTVRTDIKLPDTKDVTVNYRMYKSDKGWKIYDVSVSGISLVSTFRSSFSSEIRQTSLDNLIARLVEKNGRYDR